MRLASSPRARTPAAARPIIRGPATNRPGKSFLHDAVGKAPHHMPHSRAGLQALGPCGNGPPELVERWPPGRTYIDLSRHVGDDSVAALLREDERVVGAAFRRRERRRRGARRQAAIAGLRRTATPSCPSAWHRGVARPPIGLALRSVARLHPRLRLWQPDILIWTATCRCGACGVGALLKRNPGRYVHAPPEPGRPATCDELLSGWPGACRARCGKLRRGCHPRPAGRTGAPHGPQRPDLDGRLCASARCVRSPSPAGAARRCRVPPWPSSNPATISPLGSLVFPAGLRPVVQRLLISQAGADVRTWSRPSASTPTLGEDPESLPPSARGRKTLRRVGRGLVAEVDYPPIAGRPLHRSATSKAGNARGAAVPPSPPSAG